jgi:hypothetical protein
MERGQAPSGSLQRRSNCYENLHLGAAQNNGVIKLSTSTAIKLDASGDGMLWKEENG